ETSRCCRGRSRCRRPPARSRAGTPTAPVIPSSPRSFVLESLAKAAPRVQRAPLPTSGAPAYPVEMKRKRIYLDGNATTPPLPEVVEAVHEALAHAWGNPSSPHAEGRTARRIIDEARDEAAALLGVPESWITFTSGASESINLWLRGVARAARERMGRPG